MGVVPHASNIHGSAGHGETSGQLVECHTNSLLLMCAWLMIVTHSVGGDNRLETLTHRPLNLRSLYFMSDRNDGQKIGARATRKRSVSYDDSWRLSE